MSSAEVIKKKGRPKKTIAETITILAESAAVKVKKPRVSRKSPTISPKDDQPGAKAVAQVLKKNDVSEPSSAKPKIVTEPKTRPMKSVAAETAVLASRQVKAPSSRPEPSLILKQATAFVEGEKAVSSQSTTLKPTKVASQPPPKEFKPAGPLPTVTGLETTKSITRNPSSNPEASPFLADFFTEPIAAKQPAWSRLKKPATASPSLSNPPESTKAGDAVISLSRPDTSAHLSASSLPSALKPTDQPSPEGQLPQESASTAESATLTTPSTPPEQLPIQPAAPTNTSAKPTLQAAMSTQQPPSIARASAPPSAIPTPQAPRRTSPPSKMPPRPPPPSGPRPLKPSETPYEVLRHDPKFKALSRRWTSLIVGIPILLATSVALYGRFTETAVQRTRARDQGTSTINGGV